jgi:Na+-translocating ferredoxin:NAD+ oxidoreductase RnfG subunit/ferredoxin
MLRRMNRVLSPVFAVLLLALALCPSHVTAQRLRDIDPTLLQAVMPQAERFSDRAGEPLVMQAFRTDPATGQEVLIGYAFHTSDLPPEQIGYSGPIEAVVGMDLTGHITGVRVTYYWESIQSSMGDFLRARGFQEHFTGKHIGDAFKPYQDVEGISRATISVRALARGVRDAARRVAIAHLSTEVVSSPDDGDGQLSWLEMRQLGMVETFLIQDAMGAAEINLVHIESEPFGEYLVGEAAMNSARRALASRGNDDHLLIYGVDGARLRLFEREGWSVVQGADTIELSEGEVRPFGLAAAGLLDGQVVISGAMIIDGSVDVSKPFTIIYDHEAFEEPVEVEFLTGVAQLALEEATLVAAAEEAAEAPEAPEAQEDVSEVAADESAPDVPPVTVAEVPVEDVVPAVAAPGLIDDVPAAPAAPALDFTVVQEETVLERTLADISWPRLIGMVIAILLAMAAFFSKRMMLRGASLTVTLVYLGFVDGGFLSVSHITAAIWRGPSVFLSDIPLLIIVSFTLLTTLFWGRVFCGYLCPFGALQDLLDRIVPKRFQIAVPKRIHRPGLYLKYGILAVILVPAIAGSRVSLYQYFEPFATIFFGSPSRILWLIAGLILAASAVIPRFYCRYACPLGAALAVGSLISLKRIARVPQCGHCNVCEQKCPTGAIEKSTVDFKECVRCNVCEIKLIEKAGVCRHEMSDVNERLIQIQTESTQEAGDVV